MQRIGIVVFLVTIESYIVVTALVDITRELKGFNNVSWVLSSYQLGFVGELMRFLTLSVDCLSNCF